MSYAALPFDAHACNIYTTVYTNVKETWMATPLHLNKSIIDIPESEPHDHACASEIYNDRMFRECMRNTCPFRRSIFVTLLD